MRSGGIVMLVSLNSSWRRVVLAVLATMAFLSGSLVSMPQADAFSRLDLVFALNGNPTDAESLNGAVIPSDSNVAIWVGPRLHPAKEVTFYLNGERVRTERRAPWDFSGTKPNQGPNSMSSNEFREGTNVIEARIDGWFNRDRTIRATFTRAPSNSSTAPGLGLDFSIADDLLSSYVGSENLNGAGLVVVHPDHGIVHENYLGVFGPDRVSLIASTGKSISAGALLHIAEQPEWEFDVQGPISNVVDWGDGLPGVTTANLLSNTSGLDQLAGLGYVLNICGANIFGELERCAEWIARNTGDDFSQKLPNEVYRYGGPQWQVAGGIAETVTGSSWDQLMDEIYREPCDMDGLGFTNLAQLHLFSTGIPYPGYFDGNTNNLIPTQNPLIEGGGYLTPHDYANFLLMLLRDGKCGDTQVLSPQSVELMFSDQLEPYGLEVRPGIGYGFGWQVDGDMRIDPGFFGAISWVDLADGYGVYFVVEDIALPGQVDRSALIDAIDTAINQSDLASSQ